MLLHLTLRRLARFVTLEQGAEYVVERRSLLGISVHIASPMISDEELSANAVEFIKQNHALLISTFAPTEKCKAVKTPVSLFMAGSPGAGKTEVSKGFMERFPSSSAIRIDADDLRSLCDGYTGTNAHVFQSAASKGVNFLYDYALDHSLNCIMDGTFAYGNAMQNIERSISRGRIVEIWFVYQKLELAWEFTKAREQFEARHVSKEQFIKNFFDARANAASVKNHFGSAIKLNLLLKDYDNAHESVRLNITAAELDQATACGYSLEELDTILL